MTTQTTTAAAVLEHAATIIELHADEIERAHTLNGCWPTDPDGADRRASAAYADMIDTARLLRDFAVTCVGDKSAGPSITVRRS